MRYNNLPYRKSIRMKMHDYMSGKYFVTINTCKKVSTFGVIKNEEMILSEWGEIVREEWSRTAELRSNVKLDAFQIMPNHFHGIIEIDFVWPLLYLHEEIAEGIRTDTMHRVRTKDQSSFNPANLNCRKFGKPISNSLPTIIGRFKAACTRRISILENYQCVRVWHRGYYERLIKNNNELEAIRRYIINNPNRWEK
jgi:REP element-mobilizing transposase RayT|tara:strand:- start:43 stop:630 length:588 start_codon:yes stop_codon:yes gene_type:complete